jgi:hypothetical protein
MGGAVAAGYEQSKAWAAAHPLVLGIGCDAQNPFLSQGIWTKIEATEFDRRMLLEKLNP